jgi:hypothetical protein
LLFKSPATTTGGLLNRLFVPPDIGKPDRCSCRTLGSDRASPDRKQVEIPYCATNPNGIHPFAEGLAHALNCELFAAKESYSFVQIGTEPQLRETLTGENMHRLFGAFLNGRDSGCRPNRLGAFRARGMPQFQVTMRRRAMFLSLAEQHRRL